MFDRKYLGLPIEWAGHADAVDLDEGKRWPAWGRVLFILSAAIGAWLVLAATGYLVFQII